MKAGLGTLKFSMDTLDDELTKKIRGKRNNFEAAYETIGKLIELRKENQGYGNIINVSSVCGVMTLRCEIYEGTGTTTSVEYAAVKSAVINLTRYLAQYLKGRGIRVNCVSPGGIFDNQPESFLEKYNARGNSKGMLEGEDVAGTVVFLLSHDWQYITGQNMIVDDGFSL